MHNLSIIGWTAYICIFAVIVILATFMLIDLIYYFLKKISNAYINNVYVRILIVFILMLFTMLCILSVLGIRL